MKWTDEAEAAVKKVPYQLIWQHDRHNAINILTVNRTEWIK